MSDRARYFNKKGVKVSGYDKTQTPLTDQLKAEEIDIHYTDDTDLINKKADAVVYTPAIPADHKGLEWYRNNNFNLFKRSDVLGMITAETFNICIAGTHGKTTTSAMTAHILTSSGIGSSLAGYIGIRIT